MKFLTGYDKISCCGPLNETDETKVDEIVNSFLSNGWKGVPILHCESGLITGSHRIVALCKLNEMLDDVEGDEFNRILDILDSVESIDVTDIVNDYCIKNDITYDEIDLSNLAPIFCGTEIEQYKDGITEW